MQAGPMLRGSLILFAVLLSLTTTQAFAAAPGSDPQGVGTAVALNYCRASFHRILRYPSKRVLLEEQEKILNNLNLNGIADEEIIRLYTAVLLEISEVQIAEKEREVISDTHKRAFRRQLFASAVAIVGDLGTGHYTKALRAGCASWWDYRSMIFQRELDIWKVDKQRLLAVTDKSSLFLDTFWKLAARRSIPDHWLIRGDDLDKLEAALQEQNPEVRLRVLQRMERFMECYPPYWYYLGRTQQSLGQFAAAAQTYARLVALQTGHFRKDEMLAAALANLAMIQDHYQQPGAAETARQALSCATCVWEANLICGRILERHGDLATAEDALLRNLDVDLEQEQTLPALLGLYVRSGNRRELASMLANANIVKATSLPVLLQCATVAGSDMLPPVFIAHVASSVSADFDLRFGADDFVVQANPAWYLSSAQVILTMGEHVFQKPVLSTGRSAHELRFRGIADFGSPLNPVAAAPPVRLSLRYAGLPDVHLHLQSSGALVGASEDGIQLAAQQVAFGRQSGYRIVAADVGNARLTLDGSVRQQASPSVRPDPPGPILLPPTESPGTAPPPEIVPGPELPSETVPPPYPGIVPPLPEATNSVRGLPILSSPVFDLQ